jgi:hypothetical protein
MDRRFAVARAARLILKRDGALCISTFVNIAGVRGGQRAKPERQKNAD